MTAHGVGFDQHDLDHMDIPGAVVEVAYTVRLADGTLMHSTDFLADGPELAAALRLIAIEVDA